MMILWWFHWKSRTATMQIMMHWCIHGTCPQDCQTGKYSCHPTGTPLLVVLWLKPKGSHVYIIRMLRQLRLHIIRFFFSISIPIPVSDFDIDINSIHITISTQPYYLGEGHSRLWTKWRPVIRSTAHSLLPLPAHWPCAMVTTILWECTGLLVSRTVFWFIIVTLLSNAWCRYRLRILFWAIPWTAIR